MSLGDAFQLNWSQEIAWLNPPWVLYHRALNTLEQEGGPALAWVRVWRGALDIVVDGGAGAGNQVHSDAQQAEATPCPNGSTTNPHKHEVLSPKLHDALEVGATHLFFFLLPLFSTSFCQVPLGSRSRRSDPAAIELCIHLAPSHCCAC